MKTACKLVPETILVRQRAKLAEYKSQYQSLSDKLDAFTPQKI